MYTNGKQSISVALSVLTILLALSSFAAYAQSDVPVSSPPVSSPPASLPMIPVLSGGVGSDEIERIKSVEKEYNLKLLMTEADGVFLSDLPVTIKDKNGNVLVDTITRGPILLTTLPAGKYTVTVSSEGETKTQKVSVSAHGLKEYAFRFRTVDPKTSDDPATVQ